jgi:hypothetical protein
LPIDQNEEFKLNFGKHDENGKGRKTRYEEKDEADVNEIDI